VKNVFSSEELEDRKKFCTESPIEGSTVLTSYFYEFCVKATWRDDSVNTKNLYLIFVLNTRNREWGWGRLQPTARLGRSPLHPHHLRKFGNDLKRKSTV